MCSYSTSFLGKWQHNIHIFLYLDFFHLIIHREDHSGAERKTFYLPLAAGAVDGVVSMFNINSTSSCQCLSIRDSQSAITNDAAVNSLMHTSFFVFLPVYFWDRFLGVGLCVDG